LVQNYYNVRIVILCNLIPEIRNLLHLLENMFDRKRISATPSPNSDPNNNPNSNPNPNPKAQ